MKIKYFIKWQSINSIFNKIRCTLLTAVNYINFKYNIVNNLKKTTFLKLALNICELNIYNIYNCNYNI